MRKNIKAHVKKALLEKQADMGPGTVSFIVLMAALRTAGYISEDKKKRLLADIKKRNRNLKIGGGAALAAGGLGLGLSKFLKKKKEDKE